MIHISRLRTRIILCFVAMLLVVGVCAFALMNASSSRNATVRIDSELELGQRVLARLVRQNARLLSQSAHVLAGDLALREAVTTGDGARIASALASHGLRIGAAAVLYVDPAGMVLADTQGRSRTPRQFEYPGLLERATITGAAAGIGILANQGLQLVAIPLRLPSAMGWVVLGSPVDLAFAKDLRQLTSLDVAVFAAAPGTGGRGWYPLASTLDHGNESELQRQLPLLEFPYTMDVIGVQGTDNRARFISLTSTGERPIVAVLHRPLTVPGSAFDGMRPSLIILAIFSLFVSIVGSVWISSSITEPLRTLAHSVAAMEVGDYTGEVDIHRADEIGFLGDRLNQMRKAIAEREKRMLALAYQDQLTGLANRAKFTELLSAAIAAARPGAETGSILVMDLDRFKNVNDTLGHGVGDHVLREFAGRLEAVVPPTACLARLGGDEFAVLLTGAAAAKVVDYAKSIVAALKTPFLHEGQPLDVGTSVGIARFPMHGRDAQTLVRNADIAMYVAKRNKTGLAIYNAYYDTTQQEHLSLLGELRRAVERNELVLMYQPKVSLRSSNVSAVEALVRWNHPEKGLIHPAHFIPFAEQTGYIKVLTHWVLAEVVRQCGEWLTNGVQLQICANISARDLLTGDLPDRIAALLAEHCVPAGLICLEITESGFMEDPACAQKVLERLSGMGLGLAIDDYGVGCSSLSYIMKLPMQELKIDRSFIGGIVANPDLSNIVRSTIELGHRLGMNVVAEGVEDGNGWDLLEALGCDDAQGFFMSPPLAPTALVDWMRKHDGSDMRDTAWSGSAARRRSGTMGGRGA